MTPTRRPGIWRTSASVHATMPRYGPPKLSGIPSGWPSPAAMSAPYSPGGARTASDTGSITDTNSAPAAWARRPTARHVLEQPEDVRLGDDDAGDRLVRVGEQPLQRLEVGGAGERPVRDERDLVGLEPGPVGVGRERLAVVRVDAARDEQPLAPRRAAGHERRLGGRGAAVVVRRGHDVHRGQLGEQRLVLVDALERALADLGLVRRVGRVPLAAEQHLVDRRRAPVAVRARAEERGEVHPVAPGQRLEPGGEVELGLGVVEAERARPERLGDVVEQGVHRGDPDRLQHPGPVVGYVRPVRHVSPRRSAARRPRRPGGRPPAPGPRA